MAKLHISYIHTYTPIHNDTQWHLMVPNRQVVIVVVVVDRLIETS